MNIPLLRQIQAQIIQHPETFDMCIWDCGTAACIQGWALRFTGGFIDNSNPLKLTPEEMKRLFYRNNWPVRFHPAPPCTEKSLAKQAAARIDHFIATDGAE
jgi:hypothetical protein